MIELGLGPSGLANVRIGLSPVHESVWSLGLRHDPPRQTGHRRWLKSTHGTIRRLGLTLLPAMTKVPGMPEFLLPTPTGNPLEDVERIRATSDEQVRADLDESLPETPVELRDLYDDPSRHLARVAREILRYQAAVIDPVWPRISAVLEGELAAKARAGAADGLGGMINTLHGRVAYRGASVVLDLPYDCRYPSEGWNTGGGLTLVPSVFCSPRIGFAAPRHGRTPVITFAATGGHELWEGTALAADVPPPHVEELIGRTRAQLLTMLNLPATTGQLAERLGISAPTVSEHLMILKRNHLVSAKRSGRIVLYQRTHLGAVLLEQVA